MSVRVEGGDALRRALLAVGRRVYRLVDKALLAAAEPVRQEASRRAPVRTGRLASSIVAERERPRRHLRRVRVGPNKEAYYGLFVELGHVIRVGGSGRKGKVLGHVPARPFLRPALDARADEAVRIAAETVRSGLERLAEGAARAE